ncbi:TIM barrel protein, partial [Thermodesulfovibrionales bacterium]|nr:TIM barrel protein [Thermodesulfovibrionales bacterium]
GGDCGEFTRAYAGLIKEIHLYDIRDSGLSLTNHQPIGRGMFDFDAFFTVLDEISFRGSIILEIDDHSLLPASSLEARRLIHSHLSSQLTAPSARDMRYS